MNSETLQYASHLIVLRENTSSDIVKHNKLVVIMFETVSFEHIFAGCVVSQTYVVVNSNNKNNNRSSHMCSHHQCRCVNKLSALKMFKFCENASKNYSLCHLDGRKMKSTPTVWDTQEKNPPKFVLVADAMNVCLINEIAHKQIYVCHAGNETNINSS